MSCPKAKLIMVLKYVQRRQRKCRSVKEALDEVDKIIAEIEESAMEDVERELFG